MIRTHPRDATKQPDATKQSLANGSTADRAKNDGHWQNRELATATGERTPSSRGGIRFADAIIANDNSFFHVVIRGDQTHSESPFVTVGWSLRRDPRRAQKKKVVCNSGQYSQCFRIGLDVRFIASNSLSQIRFILGHL
jgi:hypothetical protein